MSEQMILHLLIPGNGITVKESAFSGYLPRENDNINFDPLIDIWNLNGDIIWDRYDEYDKKINNMQNFKKYTCEVGYIEYSYDHNIGSKCILIKLFPFVIKNGVKGYVFETQIA